MSSNGGYAAPPSPTQGGERFYNPPAVRRHQRKLSQQQQDQQHKPRQLQWVASEAKPRSSTSSAEAEALSVPPSIVTPASTLKATNLDRLMESVTPFIPRQYLSEVNARGRRKKSEDTHPFYRLSDLWESFKEWSVYGAEVPLL